MIVGSSFKHMFLSKYMCDQFLWRVSSSCCKVPKFMISGAVLNAENVEDEVIYFKDIM